MADRPFTDAELTTAAEVLYQQEANDDDRSVAAYILHAVLPDHDARVRADERARVAALLRKVAAGRREYADGAPVDVHDVLEAEAGMAESAAQIAEGDMEPLYALLPTWRWTPEMDAALGVAHATPPTTEGDRRV